MQEKGRKFQVQNRFAHLRFPVRLYMARLRDTIETGRIWLWLFLEEPFLNTAASCLSCLMISVIAVSIVHAVAHPGAARLANCLPATGAKLWMCTGRYFRPGSGPL